MRGEELLFKINLSLTYVIVMLDLARLAVTTMPFPVVTVGRLKTNSNCFTLTIHPHFGIFTYNILECKSHSTRRRT